jgi:hypothetical protein
MIRKLLPVLLLACAGTLAAQFQEPVKITAGDDAINVDVGHAAPFYYDWTGNGVRDLLVGQFGSGRLRIYKNHGTDTEPVFKDFEWFMAGGEIASVPSG